MAAGATPYDLMVSATRVVFGEWTALKLAVENEWGGNDTRGRALALLQRVLDGMTRAEKVHRDEIEDLLEGCTSETGWYFGGLLTFVTEQVEDEEGRRAKNFWTDTCDFQIVSPTGVALIGGGDIEGRWQQQGSERLVSTSMVKGTWIYTESEHSWLSAGMSMDLAFRLDREEGADNLNLWGTFGTPGIDLYLDNLYFDGNEACGGQVSSGTSWLRQADGTWYEMVWAEDCSGCFTVEWDFTEDLGEACVDLSGLKATVVAELEVEP